MKLVDYKGSDTTLEAATNPFAAVTRARLKAQETKFNAANHYDWIMFLVTGLFDRGYNQVQVVRLYRVIDWVIKLPKEQKELYNQEIESFE